ncbi:MAG TPA: LysR family transcriptional regulator [Micromonosporaceae bacterium]|jgi:molybdate transport repressor ModE-like protein
MIDVQRLRVLREVARHGSFSKAAEALLFTPSAVSQQIAALERTLGAAVVNRSPRGVVLTEPGRVLVEAAESISAELAQAQAEIDRLALGRSTLTVATFTSGGQRLLPAALNGFAADHPEVEVTVLEHEPEESLPLVRQGGADLALAYHFVGPPPVRAGDRSGLTWTPLLDDPMWVVLPRSHRLAERDSLQLADLADERWIQGCIKTEDVLRRYAELAGFEFRVSCTSTDYFFAQSLVAAGVGVSLIPQVALGPYADAVAAVPLRPPLPARHIGVAIARRRRVRPLAEALLEALRTTAPW